MSITTLGKEYQPQVKEVGSVLVGVAQIRIGRPSVRPAGTAAIKAVQYVGTSSITVDNTTTTSVDLVRPLDMTVGGVGNTPTGMTLASAGTYTGDYDGCFIIRATSSTEVNIYAPNGYKDEGVEVASFAAVAYDMKLGAAEPSGATIVGVPATTIAAGMTWIVPVWSGSVINKVQTGIISPYSMFSGSAESVGGVKSASFTPRIDSVKTLEAGFPSQVYDRIVEKTSVNVKFESFEMNNANIKALKDMVNTVINDSELASVPLEVVMRTRGNSLVAFWIGNAGLTQFPSYAPSNDYSVLPWELDAIRQTEVAGESDAYNVALRNTPIFTELSYIH
jgi:hypothetical protein